MIWDIDRRDFLKIGLSGVIAASGYGISKYFGTNAFLFDHLRPVLDNKSEAFYKGMINYNRITRTTCAGNCTQACGWNAFVEGNTIIRSETAADYDRFDPVAGKAYLPRGCLRGASYIEYIYGPTRIKTGTVQEGHLGRGTRSHRRALHRTDPGRRAGSPGHVFSHTGLYLHICGMFVPARQDHGSSRPHVFL